MSTRERAQRERERQRQREWRDQRARDRREPRRTPTEGAARQRTRFDEPRRDTIPPARRPRYLPRRDERRGRSSSPAGWVIALILLAGLGLLAWFLLSGGDDDADDAGTGAPPAAQGPIVAEDGTDVLTVIGDGGDLGAFEGDLVTGTSVPVAQLTPAGELWVGDEDAALFLVPLAEGSAGEISEDDVVNLTGVIRVLPIDYADRFDVASGDEDALASMGYYVEAHSLEVSG